MNRTIKLTILVAISALFVVSMFANSVSAITNGSQDGDNHPYVCIVVFYDASGNPLWYTTGVLISPTVVLTAGHGTSGAASAKVWFNTRVDGTSVPYTSDNEGLHTYPDYPGVSAGLGLPAFDYHDVGIIKLSTEAKGISQAELPALGTVDKLKAKESVDIVGYGVQVQQKGAGVSPYDSWQANGYRNFATAQVLPSKDVLNGEFLKLTANPGQDKGELPSETLAVQYLKQELISYWE